jgi:hypothetical protein
MRKIVAAFQISMPAPEIQTCPSFVIESQHLAEVDYQIIKRMPQTILYHPDSARAMRASSRSEECRSVRRLNVPQIPIKYVSGDLRLRKQGVEMITQCKVYFKSLELFLDRSWNTSQTKAAYVETTHLDSDDNRDNTSFHNTHYVVNI